MRKCLTVIVPCFNEQATIKDLMISVLLQESVKELFVVNDGSTDNSLSEIQKITDSRLVVISNSTNVGKGASVQKGFELATSSFVLIQDADLEYSPSEYSRMLEPLIEGYADVVFGSRFMPYGSRRALYFWHSMGNKVLTFFSNVFTNLYLTDMETGYKMMRLEYARKLQIQEKRFGIEPEIVAKLSSMKARIYEVPISYHGRTYAEGKKITWKDGISAFWCILKYNTFLKNRQ